MGVEVPMPTLPDEVARRVCPETFAVPAKSVPVTFAVPMISNVCVGVSVPIPTFWALALTNRMLVPLELSTRKFPVTRRMPVRMLSNVCPNANVIFCARVRFCIW